MDAESVSRVRFHGPVAIQPDNNGEADGDGGTRAGEALYINGRRRQKKNLCEMNRSKAS